jgi:hypothetical protein
MTKRRGKRSTRAIPVQHKLATTSYRSANRCAGTGVLPPKRTIAKGRGPGAPDTSGCVVAANSARPRCSEARQSSPAPAKSSVRRRSAPRPESSSALAARWARLIQGRRWSPARARCRARRRKKRRWSPWSTTTVARRTTTWADSRDGRPPSRASRRTRRCRPRARQRLQPRARCERAELVRAAGVLPDEPSLHRPPAWRPWRPGSARPSPMRGRFPSHRRR